MDRKQEIIDRLNELESARNDVGEYIIECVMDTREDEGLPPFTPEELKEAEEECDRNADILQRIEDEQHGLMEEYFLLTGKSPVRTDGIIPYYREPFPWACTL